MNSLGKHIILELYACKSTVLNNRLILQQVMLRAAEIAGASIVGSHFHAYAPHGLSGMIIIKESHLAVHTWPENNYAAVDFFSCSEKFDHESAIDYLLEKMECQEHEVQVIERGQLHKVQEELTNNS